MADSDLCGSLDQEDWEALGHLVAEENDVAYADEADDDGPSEEDQASSPDQASQGKMIECRVCGFMDSKVASHYGVVSCIPCRSFFVRGLKRLERIKHRPCISGKQNCKISYDNLDCTICRLKKCLKLGMWKKSMDDPTKSQILSIIFRRCCVCGSFDEVTRSCGPKTCGSRTDSKLKFGITCESCRQFYLKYRERRPKRCITGRKNCRVHLSDRNRCKFCRFKRCRKVGMARDPSILSLYSDDDRDIPEAGVSRGNVQQEVDDVCDSSDNDEESLQEDSSDGSIRVKREFVEATRKCVACNATGDTKTIPRSYNVLICINCSKFYCRFYKLVRSVARLRCRLERGKCDVDYRNRPLCPYCRFKKLVDRGARTDPKMMIPRLLRNYEKRVSSDVGVLSQSAPKLIHQRVCSVCNSTRNVRPNRDNGVLYCMACKMFFTQTTEQRLLRCVTGRGDCTITTENRTSCRYCRLAKCLAVGMKRDVTVRVRENQTNNNTPTISGTMEPNLQEEANIDQPRNNESSSVVNSGRSVSGESVRKCGVCGDSRNIKRCCDRLVCVYCKLFYLRFYKSSRPIESLQCLKKSYDCVITRENPFCEYCRLKKCLQIGMRTQPNMKIPESFVSLEPDANDQQVAGEPIEINPNLSPPEQTDNEPRSLMDLPETPSAGAAVIQQQLAAARRRAANTTVTQSLRGFARKSTATRDSTRANQSKLKSTPTAPCAEMARTSSMSSISSLRVDEGAARQHQPVKVVVVTGEREASDAISEVSLNDSNLDDLIDNEAETTAEVAPIPQESVNNSASCSHSIPRTSQHGSLRASTIPINNRGTVARSEMEARQARGKGRQDHQQVAKRPTTRVGLSLGLKLFSQLSNLENDNKEQEFETLTTYSYELNYKANNVEVDNGLTDQSSELAESSARTSLAGENDLNPVLTITLKTNKIVIDRRPMLHKRLKASTSNGNTRASMESESLIGPGEDCDESDREEFIEIDCDA